MFEKLIFLTLAKRNLDPFHEIYRLLLGRWNILKEEKKFFIYKLKGKQNNFF